MQLPLLDTECLNFPDIDQAFVEPNGLLAVGGDLSIKRLVEAYRNGIFPWFNIDEPILWWSPAPRSVIAPKDIHTSKSTKKAIRKNGWQVSVDTNFSEVIHQCSQTRQDSGTWISDEMIYAYTELHHAGFAHSLEVWQGDELVGGLYGVHIGKVFFGESMFSKISNASKVAVLLLQAISLKHGIVLIDCQLQSSHLDSLGATTMSRQTFRYMLDKLCALETETYWHQNKFDAKQLLAEL